jgi:hypothetical protein
MEYFLPVLLLTVIFIREMFILLVLPATLGGIIQELVVFLAVLRQVIHPVHGVL